MKKINSINYGGKIIGVGIGFVDGDVEIIYRR